MPIYHPRALLMPSPGSGNTGLPTYHLDPQLICTVMRRRNRRGSRRRSLHSETVGDLSTGRGRPEVLPLLNDISDNLCRFATDRRRLYPRGNIVGPSVDHLP